jgi:hypothetical protein
MSCDLTNGRLLGECLVGRAGIKTLYFTKYNDFAALTGITEVGGEITDMGAVPLTLFQFDLGSNVGSFEEVPTSAPENGTSFISQTITLTLFNILPADLSNLNNLKKGRWTIWALDYQDKIRMFGRTRGCMAAGGSDVSGTAPGDKRGLDLTLIAIENNFAPFMQDYTTDPFDNYANISTNISGYGAILNVSTCENNDYTTFSGASATGFSATSDGAAVHEAGTADEIAFISGEIYRVSFNIIINSGTAPYVNITSTFTSSISDEGGQMVSAGLNSFEFTCNSTTTGRAVITAISAACDIVVSNLAVQKKL